MSHASVMRQWRTQLWRVLPVVLIISGGASASAQPQKRPNLDKKVIQYLAFEKLPTPTQSLIVSAIDSFDNRKNRQSIDTLMTLLAGEGIYKPQRSLRAWSHQWLALNYFSVLDSAARAEEYVKLSIKDDVEIWREYADSRMQPGLREIYQEYWDELQQNFDKKRHSWRLAVGTISRLDYSYRSRFLEVLAGFGAPVVVDLQDQKFRIKQVLLYTRIQRMRRSIERITAGFYFEPSFLAEKDTTNNKLRITGAVGVGVVIAYPYKSGWEIGGSVEGARLLFEKSVELTFSQTKEIGNSTLSYGNFEFYVRKWF